MATGARTRPQTYEELLAILAADAARLPRRAREVAVWLSQHPDDAALGTVAAVAAAAGVQPSTLVRFAQGFGFAGWSDLQAIFKAHLRAGRPGHADPRRGAGGPLPGRLGPLVEAAQDSLARIGATLDDGAFGRMAAALAAAPMVHLLGSKRAFPVVAYLAVTLAQHGHACALVDNVGGGAVDQVGCLGPGDCVLAVSFSPYNSVTPDLARLAHERGARVLALTDSPLSPLVAPSDEHLIVVEAAQAGYRTLAATMVVALALAVEAAQRRLDLRSVSV